MTATPRSLTYWFDRGSNSPQPTEVPEPEQSSDGWPKPPKFVQKFWLKRLWRRACTSTYFEGFAVEEELDLGALAVVAVALARDAS